MFARTCAALAATTSLALSGCATAPTAVQAPAEAGRAAWTSQCKAWDEWDKPGPPYRVYGDTYYVGTCGIAAVLIASEEGHVLIDSGTEAGAQVVLANIRELGFDPADIAYILHSHEHFDHVGGFALLTERTGATIVTSPEAERVIATGEDNPEDPQHGMHPPMRPAPVGRTISGGETLHAAGRDLTAIATPGHTPGALSWRWRSCEKGSCREIVYADSLSPVSSDTYRFSDHPAYLAAYRASIERIAAQPCDIVLTPHPSASGMEVRLAETGTLEGEHLCEDYARSLRDKLAKRLAEEAG